MKIFFKLFVVLIFEMYVFSMLILICGGFFSSRGGLGFGNFGLGFSFGVGL